MCVHTYIHIYTYIHTYTYIYVNDIYVSLGVLFVMALWWKEPCMTARMEVLIHTYIYMHKYTYLHIGLFCGKSPVT